MIRIILEINKELLNFIVVDKQVFYTDRKWKAWIRCLPQPELFIKRVRMSRNRMPQFLADIFNMSPRDLNEYHNAKSDNEIADIIERDGKSKGCKVMARKEQELDEETRKAFLTSEVVADTSLKGSA